MNLYLFNPEHDYALANNDPSFVPPMSAVEFARDCEHFMLNFAEDKGAVLSDEMSGITKVVPWGWDRAVKRKLQKAGVPNSLLPEDSTIDQIRALSHRKLACEAMQFLIGRMFIDDPHHLHVPMNCQIEKDGSLLRPAAMLTSIDEVSAYIRQMSSLGRDTILKWPYSGNGTGVLCIPQILSETLLHQCEGVLRRQGMILAEPRYDVVQNFAMEFYCRRQKVEFCGYSLFKTNKFSYESNYLLSDSEIERFLSQWITLPKLGAIRSHLVEFITQSVAPCFEGPLGVDMFVFQDNRGFEVNPMVEINLRHTMGFAARRIYDMHIHPDSYGILQIKYSGIQGAVQKYVEEQTRLHPFVSTDGKWVSGFKPLTQVSVNTKYAVVITLESSPLIKCTALLHPKVG